MDLSFMPAVNAALNASAAVLLIVGLVLIRRRRINAHRNAMLGAVALSTLFLVGYVAHKLWKAGSGTEMHTTFHGEGPVRTLYLLILFTHLVLAMTVPFFAIALVTLGLKRRDDWHRRIAKFGWPIWMYVSITGVVIYFMLYHLNPV
ncbi:MAG: DUF420 domain-containing protein [Phycisphaeraceae bacterium]